MYKIKPEQQAQVITLLTEGMSVRGVERVTSVHRDTVLRLLVRVGEACHKFTDETMRDLPCEHVQLDEQWTYVGKRQRRLGPSDDPARVGDFWIWSAICNDTRIVPTFHLGKRTNGDAGKFVRDLAPRLRNRVQISTDGLQVYVGAIMGSFGPGGVDYGQIVKSFETEPLGPGRYSPPRVSSVERTKVLGKLSTGSISTSYVERLHLHNRMRCRRLTRLVDSFSRKLENLEAAIRVHYAVHNFAKPHRNLGGKTPAQAAGVADRRMAIEDLVALARW
jgi:IS1 family transposase